MSLRCYPSLFLLWLTFDCLCGSRPLLLSWSYCEPKLPLVLLLIVWIKLALSILSWRFADALVFLFLYLIELWGLDCALSCLYKFSLLSLAKDDFLPVVARLWSVDLFLILSGSGSLAVIRNFVWQGWFLSELTLDGILRSDRSSVVLRVLIEASTYV